MLDWANIAGDFFWLAGDQNYRNYSFSLHGVSDEALEQQLRALFLGKRNDGFSAVIWHKLPCIEDGFLTFSCLFAVEPQHISELPRVFVNNDGDLHENSSIFARTKIGPEFTGWRTSGA